MTANALVLRSICKDDLDLAASFSVAASLFSCPPSPSVPSAKHFVPVQYEGCHVACMPERVFEDWLRQEGARFQSIESATFPGGLRGIKAKGAIQPGEISGVVRNFTDLPDTFRSDVHLCVRRSALVGPFAAQLPLYC